VTTKYFCLVADYWIPTKRRLIFERKLLPKYLEFRRQLQMKKFGFWDKVLSTTAKFFEIDAAPWTPKFYGVLFHAFFESAQATEDAMGKAASNASHAFQYIAHLESYDETLPC